jgi:hypothetical protein
VSLVLAKFSTVAVAFAAATGLCPGAATAADGSGGVTVRLVNADPADLTARSSFALTLARRGVFTGQVVVGNTTKAPMRLAISAVDGLTAETSGAVYAGRRARRRLAARWLTPSTRSLTLSPGGDATVAFTVRVPARAAAGDNLAGLAFEDVTRRPRPRGGVTQVIRTVVGVLVTVPGRARFVPKVSGARLRRVPGTSSNQVVLRLGNAGRRLGRPMLSVTVAGASGYRRTVRRRLDTLLARSAISFPLPWPDRLTGRSYHLTVVLQNLRRHYRIGNNK